MTCPCASCALRAAWTPARRAAFDLLDAVAEAAEHGVLVAGPDLEVELSATAAGARRPFKRLEPRRSSRSAA